MRRWWWLSWLLFPTMALGTGESGKFRPTYHETIVFRNGSHPDAGYQGITLRGMNHANPTVIYGDSTGPSAKDISLVLGSAAWSDDERSILFKLDLSAIPDSAVVTDAFLVLYTTCAAAAGDSCSGVALGFRSLHIRRVIADWDATACWAYSSGTTAWNSGGATDSLASWTTPYGGVGNATSFVGLYLHETVVGATWFGTRVAASLDSLLDDSGFAAPADALPLRTVQFRWPGDGYVDTNPCGLRINITQEVEHWHNGSWENNGLLLEIDPWLQEAGYLAFATDYNSDPLKAPFVVVRYLYAVPGGGGRKGATLGATP
jgi:hypothetical protein